MTTGTATPLLFQEAWIADLKSRPEITAIHPNFPVEIREAEYQSDNFTYPNIRVSLDFMPSIEGCGPDDADIYIDVYSEEKSSKQAITISSVILQLYHKHPFTSNGIHFSTVVVRKVEKSDRTIYAWDSRVHIFCQGI